jgi:hypothetical protein
MVIQARCNTAFPHVTSAISKTARTTTGSWAFAFTLVPITVLLLRLPALASPPSTHSPVVIRGTLNRLPGNQPVLETGQKSYKLAGQSPYLLRTLQDKRLLHQEFQLVGTAGPNSEFVVQRLFAIHDGKLYKVEYYCEVCNITYVQPGHCACCGRETKLKEVPVGDDH